MARFDERTPVWDYSDNSNYDARGASDRGWNRRRAEQAARRYVAAGEPERGDYQDDRSGYGQRPTYGRGDDRHRSGSSYDADRYSAREPEDDFGDRRREPPSFWPSEFGYPAARGYSPYGGRVRAQSDGERGLFERAGDELRSWFGDRDARRRREIDHRGRGPKNYARSDERICDDINDRLTEDVWIDASEIEVTVTSGEVVLSGTVEDRPSKRRAEDCAEDVSGVKHVQNNLRYQSGVESPRLAD